MEAAREAAAKAAADAAEAAKKVCQKPSLDQLPETCIADAEGIVSNVPFGLHELFFNRSSISSWTGASARAGPTSTRPSWTA